MAALYQMCDIEQLPQLNSLKECPLLVHPATLPFAHSATVNFLQPTLWNELPAIVVDNLGIEPLLYLLQYKQEESTKEIYWRQSKSTWAKTIVNHWPKHIAIADGRLFLLGCRELWIVSRDLGEKCLALEEGRVMGMSICLTEAGEGGINIVYYNSWQGLFCREYSKSSSSSLWGRIRSSLHFSLKPHKNYSFFQIILPKLLAVAFTNSLISIYDLDRMQQTKFSLPFSSSQGNLSQKPVVRWSFSDGTDVLMIFVLFDNKITDFTLKLARANAPIFQQGEISPSLDRIARGTAIDWSASQFQKGSFQSYANKTITDLCVFGSTVIIREEQGLSILPIYRMTNLNDASQEYCLLSFESSLWREYYLDPYTPQSFYSKFQYLFEEDFDLEEIDSRKRRCKDVDSIFNLQACREKAKFRQFFTFKGKLYLARAGMITIFEEISSLQAYIEAYQEQQRLEDEQLKLSKQLCKSKSSLAARLDTMGRDDIELEYREIMGMLKRSTEIEEKEAVQARPFVCKEAMGWSLLNEKMRYYNQLIKYVLKNSIVAETSKKNILISGLVFFLSGTLNSGRSQATLTLLFVKKIQNILPDQPSQCFRSLVGKIFNNLLPNSFNLSPTELTHNDFFQFLIDCLVKSESECLRETAQAAINKLIADIAPTIDDKASPHFLRNISFVRAYLISHPPPSELSLFCYRLLSAVTGRELYKHIKQITHFIPNQLETIIKSELCLTKDISFDLFTIDVSATPSTSSQTLLEIAGGIKHSDCILPTKMDDHQRSLDALRQYGNLLIATAETAHQQLEEQFLLFYRSQLRLNHKIGSLQNILELEELALRIYLQLANREIDQIFSKEADQQALQRIEKKISIIEVSFSNFCKYIRKIYAIEPVKLSAMTYFEDVTRKMSEEETIALAWLPLGSQLLQGRPLSSLRLFAYRNVFSSEKLKKKYLSIARNFETLLNDKIHEELSQDKQLSYCEVDLLCYFLYIHGISSLGVLLKDLPILTLKKIAAFYQKFDLKDQIIVSVEPLLEQKAHSDLSSLLYRENHLQ